LVHQDRGAGGAHRIASTGVVRDSGGNRFTGYRRSLIATSEDGEMEAVWGIMCGHAALLGSGCSIRARMPWRSVSRASGHWAAAALRIRNQGGAHDLLHVVKFECRRLAASFLGVVMLFRYGMPYRVRSGGSSHLLLEEVDQAAIKTERCYTILGWIGLVLIVAGTGAQIIANLI
jgi:hypothetical protein